MNNFNRCLAILLIVCLQTVSFAETKYGCLAPNAVNRKYLEQEFFSATIEKGDTSQIFTIDFFYSFFEDFLKTFPPFDRNGRYVEPDRTSTFFLTKTMFLPKILKFFFASAAPFFRTNVSFKWSHFLTQIATGILCYVALPAIIALITNVPFLSSGFTALLFGAIMIGIYDFTFLYVYISKNIKHGAFEFGIIDFSSALIKKMGVIYTVKSLLHEFVHLTPGFEQTVFNDILAYLYLEVLGLPAGDNPYLTQGMIVAEKYSLNTDMDVWDFEKDLASIIFMNHPVREKPLMFLNHYNRKVQEPYEVNYGVAGYLIKRYRQMVQLNGKKLALEKINKDILTITQLLINPTKRILRYLQTPDLLLESSL